MELSMNAPTRAEFLQARQKYIGGSDVAAILGISPWKTATDLWLDKIKPPVERTGEANAAAKRRGSRLEPYILDMIRDEHGLEIVARNERYVDEDVPYFAAEIDAETADENVEIKTVHPFKAKEWGELDTDQLPLHYVAQVQWGLGIRRRERCRVFALIGDDLRPYVIERDDETIAAMRARAAEFWARYVVTQIAPPLDFGDRKTLDALKRLYPGTDGSTVEATAMHEHWRAVLETAQEMVGKYQGVVDGAKAHLLAEMGDAALLRFADGRALRRKEIVKKPYTVQYPASRYIDFRLVNVKET
jgi:putative phage-type endonuclease